ncbi:hypothetical protein JL193_15440 [Polaribacter batillariae]|uniref:tRNA (Guanine-N1)-methyltransferase n=1 Tax=Polaribacter batillariae TaxID=2808900 RepID=A0ABX7ST87_9FLAO|nr:hypothetical protein [Polaribacter batillariae]QTD37460.1 hypothetical protein JL193_15440 [Polaribacter batillariae]
MKFKLATFCLLICTMFSFAQENTQETVQEDNSLEGQFDKIYRTSTTYKPKGTPKRYKVVDIKKYEELKSNVLDSIKVFQKLVLEKESLLKIEKDNIQKIQTNLSKTQLDLETATNKENSIPLFGLQLNKTTYNLILWGVILVLTLALSYFAFKFSRSHVITKEAQSNLLEIEQEFEQHRKKSLEREQKLRRQLQDEINKQRNS